MYDRDLEFAFNIPCVIEPCIGQNEYGEPSYGAPITARSYVTRKLQNIRSFQGKDVNSLTQVYILDDISIGMNDRVSLPDGLTSSIQYVTTHYDEDGSVHHKVIFL